jgi:hypothetical protein
MLEFSDPLLGVMNTAFHINISVAILVDGEFIVQCLENFPITN